MKNLRFLFTTLLLLCGIVVSAHDFEVGGIYYNITDATNNTVEVTYRGNGYNSYTNEYTGSVVIPESVTYGGTTYSVTSIGDWAFNECSGLTSIEIPNSVTSIGDGAFYYCDGLKTVINYSNLTFSKGSSNYGCVAYYADKVINAPNGFVEGDFIFGKPGDVNTLLYYLGNDAELTLPQSCNGENYVIAADVFKNNTSITSIIIPDCVESIGEGAFSGCSGLTSVTIPNSVESIGDYAFYGCTNLKTVMNFSILTFSKGSTSNGYVAYYAEKLVNAPNGTIDGDYVWAEVGGVKLLAGYMGSDTELVLPSNVNYAIGDNVFNGFSDLTSVTIPDCVESIGAGAFSGCSALTSIEIPGSVTSIGAGAFSGCSGVETLYISGAIESLGDEAFAGCEKIKEIKVDGETPINGNENVFANVVYGNAILYIPNGTKSLYEEVEPWSLFSNIVEMYSTGIDEVKGKDGNVEGIYDLSGRRVTEISESGIYIVNGEKVLVK